MSSYIVPGAGNISDIGWAPVQAFIVHHLYNNRLLTTLSFIEELLPFTDIVPSATIGWLMEYTRAGKKAQTEAEQAQK
ncbi:g6410 [Coccomyxa elongata]